MTGDLALTKDKILAALPNLNLEDLTVVQSVAQSLIIGRTGVPITPAGALAALMFEAMSGPLNVPQPYATMAATKWGKQWEKKVPDLGKWLDTHFSGWSDNKITQLAFLKMLFTLLSSDLKRRNLPRSLAMAVTNLEQIPRIVENGFPGYLEAGMGQIILQPFKSPVRDRISSVG